MPSAVHICNMALSDIRASNIASLTGSSVEARQCNIFYEPARDKLLSLHDWTFARMRTLLALIETEPTTDWTYRFQIPVNCLRPLFLETPNGDKTTKYRVEGDTILTSVGDAVVLVYTLLITDPISFPAYFVEALRKDLAACLAIPITDNRSIYEIKLAESVVALTRAMSLDANSDIDDNTYPQDSWLTVRG